MAPSVVAVGTVASGTGAITPAYPTPLQVNDIIVGVGESNGGQNYPTAASSGFAHIDSVSPVVQGTNTQLSVVWRRYDGTGTAHAWGDSGDHNVGRYLAVRGCPATGNPWSVVATSVSATSSTAATWPGHPSVMVADCLILELIATGADVASTTMVSAHTNANYTGIAAHIDNWVSVGAGGGIGVWSGVLPGNGATGASTATLATAATKAYMTLAMMPAGPPGTEVGVIVAGRGQ
jgi:hypothetical protein